MFLTHLFKKGFFEQTRLILIAKCTSGIKVYTRMYYVVVTHQDVIQLSIAAHKFFNLKQWDVMLVVNVCAILGGIK